MAFYSQEKQGKRKTLEPGLSKPLSCVLGQELNNYKAVGWTRLVSTSYTTLCGPTGRTNDLDLTGLQSGPGQKGGEA